MCFYLFDDYYLRNHENYLNRLINLIKKNKDAPQFCKMKSKESERTELYFERTKFIDVSKSKSNHELKYFNLNKREFFHCFRKIQLNM